MGKDRGLDKVGHLAQAKYTLKETAELLDAYADQDIAKINDAIGDILVTLIVGASNDNETLDNLSQYIIETDNKYLSSCEYSLIEMVRDSFDLLSNHSHAMYFSCVYQLKECLILINENFSQSLSLKDCLQLAYDEIKNRTGKLVDGQFIKD